MARVCVCVQACIYSCVLTARECVHFCTAPVSVCWGCERAHVGFHTSVLRVSMCVLSVLSAVSQCARRGPVYLVFITKPFTEAPIRIKLLSGHTDHRTQPARACVCMCVCLSERLSERE